MNIVEALVYHLQQNAGVAALVGVRIYPDKLPQKPTYPSLRYTEISTQRDMHMEGASGLAVPVVQVDAFAASKAEAAAVAKAVRLALNGYKGQMGSGPGLEVDLVQLVDERALYDDDVGTEGVYGYSQDYEFHHHEDLA